MVGFNVFNKFSNINGKKCDSDSFYKRYFVKLYFLPLAPASPFLSSASDDFSSDEAFLPLSSEAALTLGAASTIALYREKVGLIKFLRFFKISQILCFCQKHVQGGPSGRIAKFG